MKLSRRNFLATCSGAVGFLALGVPLTTFANVSDAINNFTSGAEVVDGEITLTAPPIAENGNSVPIEFSAPGAQSVTIFAEGNPEPVVANFSFGKLNPSRSATTRVRLHQSQKVIVVAKMEDGSFQKAESTVKVTIGGCGG